MSPTSSCLWESVSTILRLLPCSTEMEQMLPNSRNQLLPKSFLWGVRILTPSSWSLGFQTAKLNYCLSPNPKT
jgi:hypothetical protein